MERLNEVMTKLYVGFLLIAAIVFPISHKVYFFCVVLASVIWIITFKQNLKTFKNAKINYYFAIILSVYVFLVLGLLYSDNVRQGLRMVESMSSFVFLPFLIFYGPIDQKAADRIIIAFAATICAVCITCIASMIHKADFYNQPLYFIFTNYWYQTTYFTEIVNIHPTYLSIFISFATFYFFEKALQPLTLTLKALCYGAISILSVSNLLLVSRGGLLAFVLCLLLFSFTKIQSKKKYWVVAVLALSLVVSVRFVHGFKRFIEPLSESWSAYNPNSSTNMHFKSWQCAIESLMSNRLFLGFGTGDEVAQLSLCYAKHGYAEMVEKNLNSHNQYLSTAMDGGLVALVLLLACYFFSIQNALRTSDILFGTFLLLVLTTSLFESILYVYRGIAFFAIFNALLLKKSLIYQEQQQPNS